MLPKLPYQDSITKGLQTKFGGYEHRLGASDGAIWDMENLTSDQYPLLATRKQRWLLRILDRPNGLYGDDGLYWVDGTMLYADGQAVGQVADSRKQWTTMGAYIILLPDLKYYNKLTGDFGSLAAETTATGVTFGNGTLYDEDAEANTLTAAGVDFSAIFNAGDAVTISGCTTHTENNKTPIIREISDDGHSLRFYENVFTLDEETTSTEDDDGNVTTSTTAKDYTEPGTITIKREVPELDYVCANENRLWGCKGDEIYASKLGDPFNWNVFDGISTDSFAVSVGSAGDFTGCVSYLGYPCFFKEDQIYKVYGDKPSSFEVMASASLGIEAGSSQSPAIAGEILFYLSRAGIVAYSGGRPENTASAFGDVRYRNAVGGSDGTKYYVCMEDGDGAWSLFAFDTTQSLWHREDGLEVVAFAWDGALHFLDADGHIWINGDARDVPEAATREEPVQWFAEWADLYESQSSRSTYYAVPMAKGIGKIIVRLELDEDAECKIKMQFDSGDDWTDVATLVAGRKRSYYLPIVPRRTDHFRFRLEGWGGCRVYEITIEYYVGSANRV